MRGHHHATAARPEADPTEVRGWFAGRLPDDWFDGPAEITLDTEEILLVGRLSATGLPDDTPAAKAAALAARVKRFREDTRDHRMHSEWGEVSPGTSAAIAEARARGGRIVSVGTTSLRLLESAVNKMKNEISA